MNRLMSALGRATTVWLLASWQNIVVIVLAVSLAVFQPIQLVGMQAAGKKQWTCTLAVVCSSAGCCKFAPLILLLLMPCKRLFCALLPWDAPTQSWKVLKRVFYVWVLYLSCRHKWVSGSSVRSLLRLKLPTSLQITHLCRYQSCCHEYFKGIVHSNLLLFKLLLCWWSPWWHFEIPPISTAWLQHLSHIVLIYFSLLIDILFIQNLLVHDFI